MDRSWTRTTPVRGQSARFERALYDRGDGVLASSAHSTIGGVISYAISHTRVFSHIVDDIIYDISRESFLSHRGRHHRVPSGTKEIQTGPGRQNFREFTQTIG